MAELNRERGQLILVTGFALAFTLVAIVLLLNTTIYTENIASRGVDRSPEEAVEYRGSVSEGLGDLLVETNHADGGFDESQFEDSLANLSRMLERSFEDRGTVAIVNNSSYTTEPGTLLRQRNETRQLLNASGDAGDWTLVENVEQIRRMRFNLSKGTLAGGSDDAFTVNLSTDSGNWTASIYRSGGADGDIINIRTTDGVDQLSTCDVTVSEQYVTVDLTQGTIEGVECEDYTWAETVGTDYSLIFENGIEAKGNYSMILKNPVSVVGDFGGSDDQPENVDAKYSATITLRYQTSSLNYETNVTVAPGEPE